MVTVCLPIHLSIHLWLTLSLDKEADEWRVTGTLTSCFGIISRNHMIWWGLFAKTKSLFQVGLIKKGTLTDASLHPSIHLWPALSLDKEADEWRVTGALTSCFGIISRNHMIWWGLLAKTQSLYQVGLIKKGTLIDASLHSSIHPSIHPSICDSYMYFYLVGASPGGVWGEGWVNNILGVLG